MCVVAHPFTESHRDVGKIRGILEGMQAKMARLWAFAFSVSGNMIPQTNIVTQHISDNIRHHMRYQYQRPRVTSRNRCSSWLWATHTGTGIDCPVPDEYEYLARLRSAVSYDPNRTLNDGLTTISIILGARAPTTGGACWLVLE